MKKLTIIFILIGSTMFAQSFSGLLNENYSGVHAVMNNPANLVDSKYLIDINLISMDAQIGNDYIGMKAFDLFKSGIDFENQGKRFIKDKNNGVANIDILGPSFLFDINKIHTIAISTRFRSILNVNDVNGKVIELAEKGFDLEDNAKVDLDNASVNFNNWTEFGVSYAVVLTNFDQHLFKAGTTLKYLKGFGAAQFGGKDININYTGSNTTTNNTLNASGTLEYGYTENLKNIDNSSVESSNASGFGFDLGFTYEFRPDYNQYKVRLGLSITDLGNIKYKEATREIYTLDANNLTQTDFDDLPDNTNDALMKLFGTPRKEKTLTSGLPSALHLNADWNIQKNLFLNLDTNFSLTGTTQTSSIENYFSLTPRFETMRLAVYIPLNYYQYSGFNAGAGFRAGPLIFGSNSILSNLLSSESKGFNVYAGVKIPIYYLGLKNKSCKRVGVFQE